VGRLKPTAPGVVRSLVDLGLPILTTNYDTLIEQVSGLETVTWQDGVGRVQRLLSGDEPGVLHIHGAWRVPQSVVLGIRSYDGIVANEKAQAVQQAVAVMRSLVFVGFGAGLEDPNFGPLRGWMKRVLASGENRHFRLALRREITELLREHEGEQVRVIAYGAHYEDLESYLHGLVPESRSRERADDAARALDYSELVLGGTAGQKTEVFAVAVAPDGSLIAAGVDGEILLWSTKKLVGGIDAGANRIRPKRLSEPTSYVYSVAFSSDGTQLASGEQDHVVRVWDVGSREQRWENASRHTDAVYSVAFSPDGTRLVSGGYDGRVVLWKVKTGSWLPSPDPISRVTSVAFSPDGRTVAIGYLDNHVRVWDTQTTTLKVLGEHASSVESVAFSPDGRFVASSGLDKVVKLWDVQTPRQEVWQDNPEAGRGHEYLVRGVAFSPDGRTIATASWDKTVRLWRVEDGSSYLSMPFQEGLPWHEDWIWSVAFSDRDAMVLATGGSDGLTLWRVDDSTSGTTP
jgi:WD40 repeat protein